MAGQPIGSRTLRAALCMVLLATPARAQSPAALQGSYVLVPEQSDDVRTAIHQATADAGFFVRKVGRGVLARMLEPGPELEIRFDSAGVSITGEDRRLHTPIGGSVVEVRNARGERERVSTEWLGGTLVRWFDANKAKRVYRYRVGEDGATLTVNVEVSGSLLPRPLLYRLTYRRPAGAP